MLKIKELIRKSICLALAINMLVCVYISNNLIVFAEKRTISQSTDRQAELEEENNKLRAKLDQLRENKENKKEYKRTLDEQIYVVRQQVEGINLQIEKLESAIKEKQKDIDESEKTKSEGFILLKERLKAIYMAGGDTYAIDAILGAKNFKDFLDKREIVKRVSNHDTNLIEGLKETTKKLNEEKNSINENKKALEYSKKEVELKQSELSKLIAENDELINNLSAEEEITIGKIDENDAEFIAINNKINAYFAKQKAEAEAKVKAAEEEAKRKEEEERKITSEETSDSQDSGSSQSKSKESSLNTSPKQEEKQPESSDSQPNSKGKYVWPVPGFHDISSDYYDTEGRTYMHCAIDIAGSGIYGTKVVAAARGRIIAVNASGWGGGYGTYLLIDHGNGRATLYAHMSAVLVSVDDTVEQGQKIGLVGNTGHSTGPHLHFETRLNGDRYNPMDEF